MKKHRAAYRVIASAMFSGTLVMTALGADTNSAPAAPSTSPSNRVTQLGEFLVEAPQVTRNLLQTPTVESASLDIATSVVEEDAIRLQDAATLVEAMDYSTGIFTEQRGRK